MFSTNELLDRGIVWLSVPTRLGHTVGAARNYLLEHVGTPFFFLSDDDHIVTARTDIRRGFDFLVDRGFDIVAGGQGRTGFGAAVFKRRGDTIWKVSAGYHEVVQPGVVRCDRVENTFLARTAAVRAVRWEPRLQGTEHDEFFFRASRRGLLIAQMGGTWVDHNAMCEQATNPVAGLLAMVLPVHRDRSYRRAQVGASVPLRRRTAAVRASERQVFAETVGACAIRHVRLPFRRLWLNRVVLNHRRAKRRPS